MKTTDSRLVVEIPEILHRQMRVSAAEKGVSIKNWIMIAIIQQLKKEAGDENV